MTEKDKQNFRQWEGRIFGCGYGSGELPIMKAVKIFFDNLKDDRSYDYQVLEEKLGQTVAWFLINAFSHIVIDYGTSSRYGWLSIRGEFVRDFIKDKTAEELYDILMDTREEDAVCECDGRIKEHGQECATNPMVHEDYALKLKYKKL